MESRFAQALGWFTMTAILVAGFAGSGKTEFAKMLSRSLQWALLDKDTLSRPFVEALNSQLTADAHDRNSENYLEQVRPLEYEVLRNTLNENLDQGISVVVSAPYLLELSAPTWLRKLKAQVSVLDTQLFVIWVDCDPDAMKARMVSRGAQRDHWKLANWRTYASSLDSTKYSQQADFVVDNTTNSMIPLKAQADEFIVALSQGMSELSQLAKRT